MPTLLEIAGTQYPKARDGHELPPLVGKSWGTVLAGQAESPRTDQDVIAWELFGNHALRQGDWKLRWEYASLGKSDWELFNVAADPSERHDLAAEHPDKVKQLGELWQRWNQQLAKPLWGPQFGRGRGGR
jgi:arylsulfatase